MRRVRLEELCVTKNCQARAQPVARPGRDREARAMRLVGTIGLGVTFQRSAM